ncbi:MAG: alkyl sulfatase BDS1-like metallo-beta-lactamase superfamily hydrolase, partial [Candidatus Azotimanducaceae bacterium]
MTEQLTNITEHQCEAAPAKYNDLSVLMLNCTLTRSPNLSHTEGLLQVAERIYQANGVKTEIVRPVDF